MCIRDRVIGINSAKLNSSMFEGIGFAIPSADAQPVVEDLIAYGYVKDRVALGVMVIALSPVTGLSLIHISAAWSCGWSARWKARWIPSASARRRG